MRRAAATPCRAGRVEPGTLRADPGRVGPRRPRASGTAAQTRWSRAAAAAVGRRAPPGPLAWRLATRVTLAAGLAMAGGMALSPQRWFWAVMTVYVVFLNARSRGDTIYKGIQRLGGTLLGIGSGLVLATACAGDARLRDGGTAAVDLRDVLPVPGLLHRRHLLRDRDARPALRRCSARRSRQLLMLRLEETADRRRGGDPGRRLRAADPHARPGHAIRPGRADARWPTVGREPLRAWPGVPGPPPSRRCAGSTARSPTSGSRWRR